MGLLLGFLLAWLGQIVPVDHGGAASEALFGGATSAQGRLLVASERLVDPNFEHTVVFVVTHDADGAFGLVINRPYGRAPAKKLLARLGLPFQDARGEIELAYGGPVQPAMGFVLHTPDYQIEGTRRVSDGISLTSDPRILVDIAAGRGPRAYLATLGYAGWAPGQLDAELARGDWYVVDADPALLFEIPPEKRWQEARDRFGLEL